MKNASKLLYICSGIFVFGFAAQLYSLAGEYNETYSAPFGTYALAYAICFLLPALLLFFVGRLLSKRYEKEMLKKTK